MPTAYSYLRFSSPQQAKGDSRRRQLEAARDYCQRHGLTLADVSLADMGVSAYRGRNAAEGALSRFLEMIQTGQVLPGSRLIVESLDRLSRSQVTEAFSILQRIVSAGVTVVTLIDGEREYSGELRLDELMWALMVMARAHEESQTKGSRSRANWQRKRQLAASGTALLTSTLPDWLDLQDGKAVPNAERVEVLRRMFRWCLEERLGVRAIGKRLDAEGIKPWGRAKSWAHSTVHKYLTSRAVIGEFQPQAADDAGKLVDTGEPIPDYFPVVIDPTTFYRVQGLRAEKRRVIPGPKARALLLSGLLKCGGCGGGMAHYPGRQGRGAAHHCRRSCGKNRGWPVAALEELVLTALVNRALLPLLTVEQQARLREVRQVLEAAPAKEADLRRKIETIMDAVESGSAAAAGRLRQRESELQAHMGTVAKLKAEAATLASKESGSPGESIGDRLRAMDTLKAQDREQFIRRAAAILRDTVSAVVCTSAQNSSVWRVELLDLSGAQIEAVEVFAKKLTVDDAAFAGFAMAHAIHLDEVADPDSLTVLPDAEELAAQRAPSKRRRAAS